MKLTAVLNTHGVPEITLDTIQSIQHYMTDNILVVIDGLYYKKFDEIALPAYKLKGLNHGFYKAPYRNIVLGLLTAAREFKDSDWFCYLEYDCLVGSASFKSDLLQAEKDKIWCLGNSFRRNQQVNLSYAENMLGEKFEEVVYLLGACIFYHRDFINLMVESGFFEKFLFYTNEFKQGFFPNYDAHDLAEHLLPTMAYHHGGKIREFAAYSIKNDVWAGNYRKYPIRYFPELDFREEYFLQATIMHPIKTLDHEIREFHRVKRNH